MRLRTVWLDFVGRNFEATAPMALMPATEWTHTLLSVIAKLEAHECICIR